MMHLDEVAYSVESQLNLLRPVELPKVGHECLLAVKAIFQGLERYLRWHLDLSGDATSHVLAFDSLDVDAESVWTKHLREGKCRVLSGPICAGQSAQVPCIT